MQASMPTQTALTSDAKEKLRKTIRDLRQPLIGHLTDAAKSEYRLDLPIEKAKLPALRHCRRERLEERLAELARSASNEVAELPADGTKSKRAKAQKATKRKEGSGGSVDAAAIFNRAVKEAAHTLVNRLVMLRILEHHGLVEETCRVVTGGWKSPGYENEFVHYAGPLGTDETRGYQALLEVVYAEMALDLPGLFGPVGLTSFFPVPAVALQLVVDALNDHALDSAWGDDTTLGWIYQYWNDPEREALDKKISDGGKIEPHEIASKTQMFTERYMVEWLLQNSLGLTWLAMCKQHGWTADADSVLPELDARRADWRKKREAGEVPHNELMPIEDGLESRWKYWVPQPIPGDAVTSAPKTIRELKLLDPACGSGHFLVIAFDLLASLYEEEARHRGETPSKSDIAESILANNIHGVDIDPRATQIAAAGLWLKAKLYAPEARVTKLNLVAPTFRLAALPKDDPALTNLYTELGAMGVARESTERLVASLAGVDYLGTLLRVDKAIEALVDDTGKDDGPLLAYTVEKNRANLEQKIATLLDAHASEADLGLRLEGEQLAAGLRFIEIVREGRYDIVVGNPPYQGLGKTNLFEYVVKNYPRGKSDLYAAFLERGQSLIKSSGFSAMVTMRGWLFVGQFESLRQLLAVDGHISVLGDLDRGSFHEVTGEVLATVMSVISPVRSDKKSIALRLASVDANARGPGRVERKQSGLLCQIGRFDFLASAYESIEQGPLVYWWSTDFLARYIKSPKLRKLAPVRQGVATGNDTRFLRRHFELQRSAVEKCKIEQSPREYPVHSGWLPFLKGAAGKAWFEDLDDVVNWHGDGIQLGLSPSSRYGRAAEYYFEPGIAFSMIGATFAGRAHRYRSVIGHMGSSVYPPTESFANTLCCMNSAIAIEVASALNPGLHFEVGDVNRLPVLEIKDAEDIIASVGAAFSRRERGRETSDEFRKPSSSDWGSAQVWAQRAVDRADGEPLPAYEPEYEQPEPTAYLSFAIGVALGRFGADGEGILDIAPKSVLPGGILFVGPGEALPDSLATPAVQGIAKAWEEHRAAIAAGKSANLRDWLRKDFFAHHKGVYENRPIYFPLSSEKKSFVAWVSIHRWQDNTLSTLVADHVKPVLRKLTEEINDLNAARASSEKRTAAAADKQFNSVSRLFEELLQFEKTINECATRGAPPADGGAKRDNDATFHMDLDDGVMINSAALWPLLAPQWAEPKKWWKQLCAPEAKKDYDWSHLARRYFTKRVDAKCVDDPSLAVAHGCFWRLHPAKAYAWELRLQDEIRPDFTIDEPESDAARDEYLAKHADAVAAIVAKEMLRRERKASKAAEEDSEAVDDSEEEAVA